MNCIAPEFTLLNQNGSSVSLSDYLGKYVVLFFYPKDNTPGCTLEAREFSELNSKFNDHNAVVIGISKDSVKSHTNFILKENLLVDLLSDTDATTIDQYGAWKLKKNYGREYMGIERTTVLISPNGEILKKWEAVKAKGHASVVYDALVSVC